MGLSQSSCGMCSSNMQGDPDATYVKQKRSSSSSLTSYISSISPPTTETARRYDKSTLMRSSEKDVARTERKQDSYHLTAEPSRLDFSDFDYTKPTLNNKPPRSSQNNRQTRQPLNSTIMSGASLLDQFMNDQHANQSLPQHHHQLSQSSLHSPKLSNAIRQSSRLLSTIPLKASLFKRVKVLSKSTNSSVFFCTKDNAPYAMKVIPRSTLSTAESIAQVYRQRNILAKLSSSHTVNLEFAFTDSANVYLVTDYKPNGTLADYLQNRSITQCDFAYIKSIIAQIVTCLWFLHEEQQLLFRGLQPENILFDELDQICLCDFTDSIPFDLLPKTRDCLPMKEQLIVLREENQSPEQLKGSFESASSDFYQLGIVVYELLYRKHPLSSKNAKQAAAFSKNAFDGEAIPWEFLNFLAKCLESDRHERFQAFIDIQQSALFEGFDWMELLQSYRSRFQPKDTALNVEGSEENAHEFNGESCYPDAKLSLVYSSYAVGGGSLADEFKFNSKMASFKNNNNNNMNSVCASLDLNQLSGQIDAAMSKENNAMIIMKHKTMNNNSSSSSISNSNNNNINRRMKKRPSMILSEILGEDENGCSAAIEADDECSVIQSKSKHRHG